MLIYNGPISRGFPTLEYISHIAPVPWPLSDRFFTCRLLCKYNLTNLLQSPLLKALFTPLHFLLSNCACLNHNDIQFLHSSGT